MTKRFLLLAALAATVAAPAGADAESSVSGIYAGKIQHRSPGPEIDEDKIFPGSIVLRTYRGKLTGIYVETRVFCPDGVKDLRITKDPSKSKQPSLGTKGGFAYSANGIRVQGVITGARAEGTVVSQDGECHGSGSFRIKKRPSW